MGSETGVVRTESIDAQERGRAYGQAVADRISEVRASYLALFRLGAGHDEVAVHRMGEAALAATELWRPHAAAELVGVAEGAVQPPEIIAALNARTEILAGSVWITGAECTVIGASSGSGRAAWLAQNWDWNLDVPRRRVVWEAAVPGGRYVTFTEAGMLAKIGLNSRGLALALNVLSHQTDGGRIGVPLPVIIREVLATCASVEDVADLLSTVEPSASSSLTIVCRESPAATFEVSPAGVARLNPDQQGRLAHTNLFLAPELALQEGNLDRADSTGRLHAVQGAAVTTVEEASALLASHDSGTTRGPCRHPEPQPHGLPDYGTSSGLRLLPELGRIEWTEGPPCTAVWHGHTLATS